MNAAGKRLRLLDGHEWIVAAYVVAALVLARVHGFELDLGLVLDLRHDLIFLDLVVLCFAVHLLVDGTRARRTASDRRAFGPAWRARVRREVFTVQRAWDLIRALLLLKLLLVVYCNLKQAIFRMHPALFDDALRTWDVRLHGGLDPTALALEYLGRPAVVRAFDCAYVAWYAIKAPVVIAFVLVRDRRLQVRFFAAYFCLWIVGGLWAVAVPSLGPVFVQPQRFAGLEMPIARGLQQELWTSYGRALASPAEYTTLIYEGIAAFPSLHVAVVALFALFLARVHRGAALAMGAYTLVIQVGAVLLGWHYAVDGWFGIALALTLWWAFVPPPPVGRARSPAESSSSRPAA